MDHVHRIGVGQVTVCHGGGLGRGHMEIWKWSALVHFSTYLACMNVRPVCLYI